MYHSPTGQDKHHTRDDVSFRRTILAPGKPDTQEPGAPPHDSHAGVLEIPVSPFLAPPVLREGVYTTPHRDHSGVPELLAASASFQPCLANQQHRRHEHAVDDEAAAHDEVRETLPEVISVAEPERGDPAEQHLDPRDKRNEFSGYPVRGNNKPPDLAVDTALEVEFEVDAECNLRDEHDHHPPGEFGMDVWGELSAFVRMGEEPFFQESVKGSLVLGG